MRETAEAHPPSAPPSLAAAASLPPLPFVAKAPARPISYAAPPVPRWWRRPAALRRVGAVVVAVVLLGAAAGLVPRLVRNANLLALQRACAAHALPDGFVAFDTHPDAARRLIAAGTHEAVYAHPGHAAPPGAPSPAGYVLGPWRQLYAAVGPGTSRASDATLFVGLLTPPGGGDPRLVCVDVSVIRHGTKDDPEMKSVYLRWAVVRLGTAFDPPAVTAAFDDQYAQGLVTKSFQTPAGKSASFVVDGRDRDIRARLLLRAGKRDPSDPSRVTIEGENWASNGAPLINLRLGDDGQLHVTEAIRPLERRSPL